ncbi:MAG TPA: RidA family protein [Dehalococcoidia bacterium]|nr:RidA family protein [Dehalococcoidia bacterium]
MPREFLNPEGMATPPSNIYHHVVKVGNTVYIAGQLARDLEGRAMYPGDAEAQTRQAWANLEIAVKAAGGALTDIVKTNTYVVGAENLPKVRAARLAVQPPERPPTSTTVVVAGLADPELLVEVEAIAVLGD